MNLIGNGNHLLCPHFPCTIPLRPTTAYSDGAPTQADQWMFYRYPESAAEEHIGERQVDVSPTKPNKRELTIKSARNRHAYTFFCWSPEKRLPSPVFSKNRRIWAVLKGVSIDRVIGIVLRGYGMDGIAVAGNISLEASPAFGGLPCTEMEFLAFTSCTGRVLNSMLRGALELSAGPVVCRVTLVVRGRRRRSDVSFWCACEARLNGL